MDYLDIKSTKQEKEKPAVRLVGREYEKQILGELDEGLRDRVGVRASIYHP